MSRYILLPGYIRSKTDGDLHFISASKLMDLYCVPYDADWRIFVHMDYQSRYEPQPGDIICLPRWDGQYPVFDT